MVASWQEYLTNIFCYLALWAKPTLEPNLPPAAINIIGISAGLAVFAFLLSARYHHHHRCYAKLSSCFSHIFLISGVYALLSLVSP